MPLSFNHERMDVFEIWAGVGNDGALGNLPIPISRPLSQFVYANGDTIKVEACQLAAGLGTEVRAAVSAERENIHQDRIVGVVDGVRERPGSHDSIDDGWAVTALNEALVGRIDVAVEDARDVVAVVDPDELTA